jgi:hypothetical protein
MKRVSAQIRISILLALVSAAAAFVSYDALRREESLLKPLIGSLRPGSTRYVLQDPRDASRCVGAGHLEVVDKDQKTTLSVRGWISLSLFGDPLPVRIEGTMLFNAMGQLTIAFLRATIRENEIRLGTEGINPISLRLYRGAPGSPPLFEQVVPGPVEIFWRGDRYDLFAPLSTALGTASQSQKPTILPRIAEVSVDSFDCTPAKADAFDLNPLVQMAGSISQKIESLMRSF